MNYDKEEIVKAVVDLEENEVRIFLENGNVAFINTKGEYGATSWLTAREY